jgi:hypothetical protein
MRIQVEHHADLGAAPRSLYRGERRIDIIEIIDQWYGPGYRYVKVRGRDSSVYIDEIRDQWELIMFSAASAQRLATRHDLARSPHDRTLQTTSCSRAWSINLEAEIIIRPHFEL